MVNGNWGLAHLYVFCKGGDFMHRNPVVRGLVNEPEQWSWSSYRRYAFGEEGAVRINRWGEAKIKIATPAA